MRLIGRNCRVTIVTSITTISSKLSFFLLYLDVPTLPPVYETTITTRSACNLHHNSSIIVYFLECSFRQRQQRRMYSQQRDFYLHASTCDLHAARRKGIIFDTSLFVSSPVSSLCSAVYITRHRELHVLVNTRVAHETAEYLCSRRITGARRRRTYRFTERL